MTRRCLVGLSWAVLFLECPPASSDASRMGGVSSLVALFLAGLWPAVAVATLGLNLRCNIRTLLIQILSNPNPHANP